MRQSLERIPLTPLPPPAPREFRNEPDLDLDINSTIWLDNLHNKKPFTMTTSGDCQIPFESPLWYRNVVPETIESFVSKEVFSDIYAAIAESRKKATQFSKIMRGVICATTGFFPILFMKVLLERHEFKRCFTKKLQALNRHFYEGKLVLDFTEDNVIFRPSKLPLTITPTQFDYRLGNESMANASPFNNNFHVVQKHPLVAVVKERLPAAVPGNESPTNNPRDDTFVTADGTQVIYPILVQNTGGVNAVSNKYQQSLPRNISPPRSRLSSLSVPETTESIPSLSKSGKSLSSKDVIPSPRPPTRTLSPERRSSPRSFQASLKMTPAKDVVSYNHESKAIPSINNNDTITMESEIKSAMMKDQVPLVGTITPPRPPTITIPTMRSV